MLKTQTDTETMLMYALVAAVLVGLFAWVVLRLTIESKEGEKPGLESEKNISDKFRVMHKLPFFLTQSVTKKIKTGVLT